MNKIILTQYVVPKLVLNKDNDKNLIVKPT